MQQNQFQEASHARQSFLYATALAVEAAVLHSFVWHERWTWNDRTSTDPELRRTLRRLLKLNLTTGLISIPANLVLLRLVVGTLHLPYLPASALSILTASLANFVAGEWLVFRMPRP